MEAIRKQATKRRDKFTVLRVYCSCHAVLTHLGSLNGEAFMVDEDDLQCHRQLQNLYESTRAAKHLQRNIVCGVEGFVSLSLKQMEIVRKLAERCNKYGIENQNSGSALVRAVLQFGTSYSSMEDEREALLGILSNQVSEPMRTLINGAPLEDARYLTQQYDKLQQESVMRLKVAEGRLTELKSAMMALGKEATDAMLSVADQQQKITFHGIIHVDAERSYHQSIVVILEKLHAEMMLEKELSVPSSPTFLTTQTDADARSTTPGDPKLSDSGYHEENELQDTIFIARVIHPFDAQADGELSLTVGDYIIVWQVAPTGWSKGECNGEAGWFPSAYVERRQTTPSSTVAENSSRPDPRNNFLSLPSSLSLRSPIPFCFHCRCLPSLPPDPPDGGPLKSLGLVAVFFAVSLGFASSPPPIPRLSIALASNCPPAAVHEQELDQHEEPLRKSRDDPIFGPRDHQIGEKRGNVDGEGEDMELKEAFEKWKSKSFSLTVPLRVVALRGSVPPSWVKEFMQSQGKRSSLQFKMRECLEGIFSDMSTAFTNVNVKSLSTASGDLVTIGDSWLTFAIKQGLIEPLQGADDQDWFKSLSDKWKIRSVYGSSCFVEYLYQFSHNWIQLRRPHVCKDSPVSTFLQDWADLFRPELSGRVAMVNCPREVVGAVLKYMGASYKTKDIDSEVFGGKVAVKQNLTMLAQQRMRNVAAIVPRSGASIWTDLWAVPAASRLNTKKLGGRVIGPSPLIHQWIEFCIQTARALPFLQTVLPGAIAPSIDGTLLNAPGDISNAKQPKLDTNLIGGVAPPEIRSRANFWNHYLNPQRLNTKG
ncbi:hypothetical protein SAY86_019522 [Trapa natans]|uniref:SH3 domain-containing protein n=1 Tax=Trapa natans TaxID=22666 RepID=A0AAN7LHG3_TRANT|nr:hypothetical protein SAY86_019522 [Trapa natans]